MNNIKETMEKKPVDLYEKSIKFVEGCIKNVEMGLRNTNDKDFKKFLLTYLRKHYDQKCKILEERIEKGLPLEDPPEIIDIITPKSYILKDGELVPIPPREEGY
jgi:hypothetical protein